MVSPSSHGIQKPQWDPATVNGLVFGLIAIFLAIPGATVAYIKLHERRRKQNTAGTTPDQHDLRTMTDIPSDVSDGSGGQDVEMQRPQTGGMLR